MFAKLLGMIVLMLTNFLAAMYLETRLAANSGAESIAMIIGIVIFAAVILGLFVDATWSWPLSTIFFSASLGNISLLYYFGDKAGILVLLVYLAAVFFGFIGLMISALSVGSSEPETAAEQPGGQVEPYSDSARVPAGTSYVWPKEKKAKKSKAKRKSGKRKK
jgi:hypothetical protein